MTRPTIWLDAVVPADLREASRLLVTHMPDSERCILAINGGSSSIRFACHEIGAQSIRKLHGKLDRIGQHGSSLTFAGRAPLAPGGGSVAVPDSALPVQFLLDWLEQNNGFDRVAAVGHRVVHGMQHTAPELVTPALIDELRRFSPFDPEHLPREIEIIEAIRSRHPELPQVVCFDTTFHHDMPRVAKLIAVPRRYEAMGIQRYGFHGLSYAYLMEELLRLDHRAATSGRVILAHLGSGASMAAVRDGRSIDTSMGFTPASGLPMSTRSGDLDPGIVGFLARAERMTVAEFDRMVNHASGLLGISETSSDVRDLLAREAQDVRAAEAVALFCMQARKGIGALAAVLGGLDTLVFAGGIGENAPLVRERVCEGLGFLGIQVEAARNQANAPLISTDSGTVRVRIIPTDEELMISRSVARLCWPAATSKP